MLSKTEMLQEAIKRKHEEIKQQEATIDGLTQAISAQQSIIGNSNKYSINELYIKRQDLLAEAATGVKVEKQLEKLAAEIAEKESINTAVSIKAEDAKQAISGLERKRTEANKTLELLKDEMKAFAVDYLLEQGRTLCDEFNENGIKLAATYQRIRAISDLIINNSDSHISGSGLMGTYSSYMFDIPSFPAPNAPDGFIFRACDINLPEHVRAEKANLAKLGINI